MRAFLVTLRAIISYYQDLFLMIGVSVLWWLTGGFMVPLAVFSGWTAMRAALDLGVTPFDIRAFIWVAPLIAIPAGPASAALINVARRSARERHVEIAFFWEGFRIYWRKALAVNAVSMGILSLLLLNLLFYLSNSNPLLQTLIVLWLYMILAWAAMQIFLYPVLLVMEKPTVLGALRNAVLLVFTNPLFSLLLVIIAVALTGLSVFLAILVVLAWPAVMGLLGEHSLLLFLERLGLNVEDD